ncbi:hypothetical protein [Pseudorhizobium pelagicum]|uniref:Uncharacterized protein n=1 Tax=Pseudorhizobium pelagicum TaxID=1509405 RepID=A0A922P414_9HYPH|nr:hypothetical protein [Pseudorhizobium pelagicum]KEQ10849.1 hypothetical protein GV68_00790 [Pseudorhizobium pelagicum]
MMMSKSDLSFSLVGREELASVLRGESGARDLATQEMIALPREKTAKHQILIWHEQGPRPIAIVVSSVQARDELLAWLVTFHGDLAPLTSWCYLLTSEDFERYHRNGSRYPTLNGLEAAWLGAIIADAMTSSRSELSSLSLSVCLSTETFAVARAAALYGPKNGLSAVEQLETAKQVLQQRAGSGRAKRNFATEVLASLMPGSVSRPSRNGDLVSAACRSLVLSSHDIPSIPDQLVREFINVSPVFDQLGLIEKMPAESRVRFLRLIKEATNDAFPGDAELYNFVAGYVISRIGGAERDFRLAQDFKNREEVLAWAAIAGGLGVETFWTNAFEGLGRLVAKELLRPLSLDEFPDADISLDEIRHLEATNGKLPFRTTSRNSAIVALQPGVNVTVALIDTDRSSTRTLPHTQKDSSQPQMLLDFSPAQIEGLVERLLPLLERRLNTTAKSGKYSRSTSKLSK